MNVLTKATAIAIATTALVGVAGLAAPAQASGVGDQPAPVADVMRVAAVSNGYDIVNQTDQTLYLTSARQYPSKSSMYERFASSFVEEPPAEIAPGTTGHFEVATGGFMVTTRDYSRISYQVGKTGPIIAMFADAVFTWPGGSRLFDEDKSSCWKDDACLITKSEGKGTRTVFTVV